MHVFYFLCSFMQLVQCRAKVFTPLELHTMLGHGRGGLNYCNDLFIFSQKLWKRVKKKKKTGPLSVFHSQMTTIIEMSSVKLDALRVFLASF